MRNHNKNNITFETVLTLESVLELEEDDEMEEPFILDTSLLFLERPRDGSLFYNTKEKVNVKIWTPFPVK